MPGLGTLPAADRNLASKRAVLAVMTAAAAILTASGCRNPFNPQSDIELVEISNSTPVAYSAELLINCSTILAQTTVEFNRYQSYLHIVSKNRVIATLRRIRMVYTDPLGNPITAYKDTGGRSYSILERLAPQAGNAAYGYGEGTDTQLTVYPIDNKVLEELDGYQYGTMYLTFTLYGDDENGYDVRLSGTTTIKLYGTCRR
jgi:hypothetical protein